MDEKGFLSLLESYKPEGSNYQKWHFFYTIEKLAEKRKKEFQNDALAEVGTNNDFVKSEYGAIQRMKRTERKPKESLDFVLDELGLLSLCKKDEIDLRKVDELVKAGKIAPEAVSDHISIKETYYLKNKNGGK